MAVTEVLLEAVSGDPGSRFPFFQITDNPDAVMLADYCRVGSLIVGFMFAATALFVMRKTSVPRNAPDGFRWRIFAILTAAIYVCGTEYQRLGYPITIRLPLGMIFLGVSVYSLWLPIKEELPKVDLPRE